MVKKSQQVIDFENRLREAEKDASRKHKAMMAYSQAANSIERHESRSFVVDLILRHPITGRTLMEPIAVLIDESGSLNSYDVVDAYEWASRESKKILGQLATDDDYAIRDLAEKVRLRLLCSPAFCEC